MNKPMTQDSMRIEKYHRGQQEGVVNLLMSLTKEFGILVQLDALKDIEVEHDRFWVALVDQRVIGTVGLKFAGPVGIVRKMCVHGDFRGPQFGIAQQLLSTLEMECKDRNIDQIYLGTRSLFKAAHRFYEKAGYIEILSSCLPKEFPMMPTDDRFYKKKLS